MMRHQVIRRPPSTSAPTPVVRPIPVTPKASPTSSAPRPRPAVVPVHPTALPGSQPAAPAAAEAPPPRPEGIRTEVVRRPGRTATSPSRGYPRTPSHRAPATPEEIAALARKERVPNRIAKGELDGKMKCRVWKKLHAEEAKRFDQAWTLVEANPGLELADAFGVVQSGLPVADFLARRARARKREAIKVARATVAPEAIDAFVTRFIEAQLEAAFVLGERTVLDQLKAVAPVSFELVRTGKLEKLNVVALARRATWDRLLPGLPRDSKLAHKPAAVARQPARRPVNDPRPFLEHLGKPVLLQLRNGLGLQATLRAVGPFDVLVGEEGEEVFVPLHALVSWSGPAPA